MSTQRLWGAQLHGDRRGANPAQSPVHTISWCSQQVLCGYPIETPWFISSVKCCSAGMRTAKSSPVLHIFTCMNCFLFFSGLKKTSNCLVIHQKIPADPLTGTAEVIFHSGMNSLFCFAKQHFTPKHSQELSFLFCLYRCAF